MGKFFETVIDGARPTGIELEADITWRKDFLRKIGYKLSSADKFPLQFLNLLL